MKLQEFNVKLKGLIILLLTIGLGSFGISENEINTNNSVYKKATFAGGCFWCMQPPYDKLNGVVNTTVGYTGGKEKNPTYKEVSYGRTSHTEAIEITYDPLVISYNELLDIFWMNIDPTDNKGQFVDRGSQYRPAVFYHDDEQRTTAEKSKLRLERSSRFDKPLIVEITKASEFWKAEDYHQKYYIKSPSNYYSYRRGSGRDQFIKKYWGEK